MNIPSVLIIKKNSILTQAMRSILHSSGSKINVLNSTAIDLQHLIADIGNLDPDVVLIEESMTIENSEMLPRLLMVFPNKRLIVVSNDSNWLHIYRKNDMLMTRPSDLLSSITSD